MHDPMHLKVITQNAQKLRIILQQTCSFIALSLFLLDVKPECLADIGLILYLYATVLENYQFNHVN